MKFEIFTIYDSKAESYSRPMFFETKGVAIRSFMDVLKAGDSQISKYPEDYTLFHLGTWEDQQAKFESNSTPISAGVAIEFLPKISNPKPLSPIKTDDHASEVRGA